MWSGDQRRKMTEFSAENNEEVVAKPKVTRPYGYDKLDDKKKAVADALIKNMGLITAACMQTGISRQTYYTWIKEDSLFADICDQIQEHTYDIIENKLVTNILKGDTTALIYYCKTKMRHRGFSDKLEISGINGAPIQTQTNINFITNEADVDAVMRLKIQAVKEHKELQHVQTES